MIPSKDINIINRSNYKQKMNESDEQFYERSGSNIADDLFI